MTHLALVGPAPPPAADQSTADRVRRLQAEAAQLAREHIDDFDRLLRSVVLAARDVADGGQAYPAGIRELARRLGDDLEARSATLEAIASRH